MAYNFKSLADVELLKTTSDSVNLIAEEDGKIVKIAADNVGGFGLPEGTTAHQHLVTDDNGNIAWEDKLAYAYNSETAIMPETTCEFVGDSSYWNNAELPAFTLELDKEYKVVWNGTAYVCVSTTDGESGVMIGNSGLLGSSNNTGEPFAIFYNPSNGVSACSATSGNHTFSIGGIEETVKTIDPKYLPEIIPEGTPFQQLVTDINGRATWEDKPFGEKPLIEVRESESTYSMAQHEATGVYYLTAANVNNGDPFELLNDDRTRLRFDGAAYPLDYVHVSGSGSAAYGYYGNASIIDSEAFPDTGEPFAILSGAWFFSPYPDIYDFMTEVQFPIIVARENYPRVAWETWGEYVTYPIDSKYLPSEVPVIQSAQVGQTIVVKSVDENGKPTEWEAADVGGAEPDVIIAVDGDINAIIDYGLAGCNPRFIKGSYADLYNKIFVNKTVPTVVLWNGYGQEEWTNEILPCQLIQTHIEEERIDLHFDWRWINDEHVVTSHFILYLNSDGSMSGYTGGFTQGTGYSGSV